MREYVIHLKTIYSLNLVTEARLRSLVEHGLLTILEYEYITEMPFYQ